RHSSWQFSHCVSTCSGILSRMKGCIVDHMSQPGTPSNQPPRDAIEGTIRIPVPDVGFAAIGSAFTLGGLRRFGPISMFDSIRITWPAWSDEIAEAVLGHPIAGDLA